MFKLGDFVRLKAEYRSETERSFIFQITNVNEVTKRCYITLMNGNFSIPPTELVSFEMIEKI